ncbi:MAG: glutaredoxin 3 [Hyphomicrobiales bacterium]
MTQSTASSGTDAGVTIYTTAMCPYCHAAKQLLKQKGVAFHEIDVSFDPDERHRMTQKAGGRRTVPQIFIAGRHVGGCDDLYALDRAGGLDPLLAMVTA